jgi:hypothetical protein
VLLRGDIAAHRHCNPNTTPRLENGQPLLALGSRL